MPKRRLLDVNNNSLSAFCISTVLAVSLGGLAIFTLLGIHPSSWGNWAWQGVFVIGAILHVVVVVGEEERWDATAGVADVLYLLLPVLSFIAYHIKPFGAFPGRLIVPVVAIALGAVAFLWGRMAWQILKYGWVHGLQPVVEDLE